MTSDVESEVKQPKGTVLICPILNCLDLRS